VLKRRGCKVCRSELRLIDDVLRRSDRIFRADGIRHIDDAIDRQDMMFGRNGVRDAYNLRGIFVKVRLKVSCHGFTVLRRERPRFVHSIPQRFNALS
jgi:hypothetical protein